MWNFLSVFISNGFPANNRRAVANAIKYISCFFRSVLIQWAGMKAGAPTSGIVCQYREEIKLCISIQYCCLRFSCHGSVDVVRSLENITESVPDGSDVLGENANLCERFVMMILTLGRFYQVIEMFFSGLVFASLFIVRAFELPKMQ